MITPPPQGDEQDPEVVMRALNNAVVEAGSSMIGGRENEDALLVLTELLAQEVIDPNVGDEILWSRVRDATKCNLLQLY